MRTTVQLSALAVAFCALSACSSGSDAKHGVTPQKAWCRLKFNETSDQARALMGKPNGHKADSYKDLLDPGDTSQEWDYGNDIFLATFTAGRLTGLQAYAGSVGPVGAKDISCDPFRGGGS